MVSLISFLISEISIVTPFNDLLTLKSSRLDG